MFLKTRDLIPEEQQKSFNSLLCYLNEIKINGKTYKITEFYDEVVTAPIEIKDGSIEIEVSKTSRNKQKKIIKNTRAKNIMLKYKFIMKEPNPEIDTADASIGNETFTGFPSLDRYQTITVSLRENQLRNPTDIKLVGTNGFKEHTFKNISFLN